MCLDLGGECEGGCTHMGGLLDQVVSGECLPRSGDCGAGIVGSCELLHACDGMGGEGVWPNACAAGWWYGATVGSVW